MPRDWRKAAKADGPYLYRTPGCGPSQMAPCVGASVSERQDDRVTGNDEVLDVHMEIKEGLVVAADGFGSGRRACSKRIAVLQAVEISGRFVVSAIPDLINKPPHLDLALGTIHLSHPLPEEMQVEHGLVQPSGMLPVICSPRGRRMAPRPGGRGHSRPAGGEVVLGHCRPGHADQAGG
jgi:hypothetical protein